jgi:hypothetical protein
VEAVGLSMVSGLLGDWELRERLLRWVLSAVLDKS